MGVERGREGREEGEERRGVVENFFAKDCARWLACQAQFIFMGL